MSEEVQPPTVFISVKIIRDYDWIEDDKVILKVQLLLLTGLDSNFNLTQSFVINTYVVE